MKELERFILDHVPGARKRRSIEPGEDLLAGGTLDSLSLMELVGFIERRYGIEIGDEDLVIDNFATLARMQAFIESKSASPA
jgi:acyl carrier protein